MVAAFSMLGKARMTPRVLAGDDEPLVVETDQVAEILGPRGRPIMAKTPVASSRRSL